MRPGSDRCRPAALPRRYQPDRRTALPVENSVAAPDRRLPRAMTRDEASAYYLEAVAPHNHQVNLWNCAESKKRGGLSWRENRRWANRGQGAIRRWGEALSAVEWPEAARQTAVKLVDRTYAEAYRLREAYRHPTPSASLLSGDWARFQRTISQTGEAAAQLRLRLGLPQPPRGKKYCNLARAYERQLKREPRFVSPYAHEDLSHIEQLLARAGIIETPVSEAGGAVIRLTDRGLETARQMTNAAPDTPGEAVLAALLSPEPEAALPPASAPSASPSPAGVTPSQEVAPSDS
jgi:hypothetical protein